MFNLTFTLYPTLWYSKTCSTLKIEIWNFIFLKIKPFKLILNSVFLFLAEQSSGGCGFTLVGHNSAPGAGAGALGWPERPLWSEREAGRGRHWSLARVGWPGTQHVVSWPRLIGLNYHPQEVYHHNIISVSACWDHWSLLRTGVNNGTPQLHLVNNIHNVASLWCVSWLSGA